MLNSVSEVAWSPDGQWITFTSMVASTDDDEVLTGRKPLEGSEKKKREEEERIRLRSTTKVWYRVDGRGFFEKFSQVFVMPAPTPGDNSTDPAAIRRLTSGEFDHVQPSWTPDSTEIGVLCNRAEDQDRFFFSDLWVINRESGNTRRITDGTLQIASYAWSPGGSSVILAAAQDRRIESGCNSHLYLASRNDGDVQVITADLDNPVFPEAEGELGWPGPYRPQWSADGQRVYFLLTEQGCVNVYRIDISQKTIIPLSVDEHLTYFLALLPD